MARRGEGLQATNGSGTPLLAAFLEVLTRVMIEAGRGTCANGEAIGAPGWRHELLADLTVDYAGIAGEAWRRTISFAVAVIVGGGGDVGVQRLGQPWAPTSCKAGRAGPSLIARKTPVHHGGNGIKRAQTRTLGGAAVPIANIEKPCPDGQLRGAR